MLRSKWLHSKTEVVAENGMVVSKHPLAAEAGVQMLQKGGNAVDAAVATGFAICVVEPMMTSLGGCGFMIIRLAKTGEEVVVDYSPRAPKAAYESMYELEEGFEPGFGFRRTKDAEHSQGYKSIAVPGTVAGLCLAHQKYGSLPLSTVMEPAIKYAEEGFDVSWFTSLMITSSADVIAKYPGSAAVLFRNGFPLKPSAGFLSDASTRLVQKDLANTMRKIAKDGPDVFYRGEIARAIAADMRKNGGLITEEDLAEYKATIVKPSETTYRGYRVVGVPTICGSQTAFETLNILEGFDMASLGHNSVESLHLFAEAARKAYVDRFSYLGDPDYLPVPLEGLNSKAYAAELRAQIDRSRAFLENERTIEPWITFARDPQNDPWKYDSKPRPAQSLKPSSVGDDGTCTTHFSVVDKDLNMISCTQTAVSAFGSRVIMPDVGVLFNNAMVWFNPEPGTVNSIAPWKRPLVNMTPLMVTKDGKPFMTVGAPGGRRIINALTQVVMNVIDYEMGMQDAIAVPRIDCSGKETVLDSRIDEKVLGALRDMGHYALPWEETFHGGRFSTPLGIMVDPKDGKLHSGVDIFRIAEAIGY